MSYQSDMIKGIINLIEEKITNASNKISTFAFLSDEIKNKHATFLQAIKKKLRIAEDVNEELMEKFIANESSFLEIIMGYWREFFETLDNAEEQEYMELIAYLQAENNREQSEQEEINKKLLMDVFIEMRAELAMLLNLLEAAYAKLRKEKQIAEDQKIAENNRRINELYQSIFKRTNDIVNYIFNRLSVIYKFSPEDIKNFQDTMKHYLEKNPNLCIDNSLTSVILNYISKICDNLQSLSDSQKKQLADIIEQLPDEIKQKLFNPDTKAKEEAQKINILQKENADRDKKRKDLIEKTFAAQPAKQEQPIETKQQNTQIISTPNIETNPEKKPKNQADNKPADTNQINQTTQKPAKQEQQIETKQQNTQITNTQNIETNPENKSENQIDKKPIDANQSNQTTQKNEINQDNKEAAKKDEDSKNNETETQHSDPQNSCPRQSWVQHPEQQNPTNIDEIKLNNGSQPANGEVKEKKKMQFVKKNPKQTENSAIVPVRP